MIKLIKSTFLREALTKQNLVGFIKRAKVLSMGEECRKFENAFVQKQDRRFAVFVSSGSSANLVLIQAFLNLGLIKKSDRVGFSALTWSTDLMPLIQLGLKPAPIDCELDTLNVSPRTLAQRAKGLKALLLTNVLGLSDDIEGIRKICKKNNILLLEDNCESLGSRVGNKLLGNFGFASTFSFYVGHHLSTIEGGMVCTDDKNLYNMLLLVRAHGWDRNLDKRARINLRKKYKTDEFYGRYTFYDLAYNARPAEINGFIGNLQIRYWDEIVKIRERNFKIFNRLIRANRDFIPLQVAHMSVVSNFAMPLLCKNRKIFKKYRKKFEDSDVEIRPIIAGDITQQPFYKKYIKNSPACENAEFIHKNGFYFPNNPELTKKEIMLLSSLLTKN